MSWPSDLSDHWRSKAEDLRRYGASEAAATLEACADELEQHLREWELEVLTLDEAAEESGYSRSSFERWISNGEIGNAGEEGAPRVLRKDLPRKPPEPTADTDDLPDVEELLEPTSV